MNILKIMVSNYRNCIDDLTLSFMPISKKTQEDLEYELNNIDDGLYTFRTMAIVGKNASGKTTMINLLNDIYELLGTFRLKDKDGLLNDFKLAINFYHDKKIYWYRSELIKDVMTNVFIFKNESIYVMPYKKSKIKYLDDISKYRALAFEKELPDDTSSLFYLLKNRNNFATRFYSRELPFTYKAVSFIYDKAALNINYLNILLKLFDSNIASIQKIGDSNYEVNLLDGRSFKFNDLQLDNYLSAGTSKGLLLYTAMIKVLKDGGALLIDEIENHFHRTLVDNIIDLFKDPSVNKHGASIIFTTHYPELLDLFNRSDNIWITKQDQKVYVENMYQQYGLRSELSKSKKFYQNAFDTAVNYDVLMALKKELINNG